MLLTDYLERAAINFSTKTAIKTPEESINYGELLERANSFTIYLSTVGIKERERIVINYGNVLETIIAFFGAIKIGAIVSVISPELPQDKALHIVSDSGAKVLCTDDVVLGKICSSSCHIVSRTSLSETIRAYKGTIALIEKISSSDLASIIYTSGSTGEPKGVMMTHSNIIAATESINSYLENQFSEVILCALPLSFDYGLYQMIMCVSKAATLILERNFLLPINVMRKIEEYKVTAVPCVPSMITLMWEFLRIKKYDLSSVRYVTNTGAALGKKQIEYLKQLFPNAKIYSMYGVTECKRCTYLPPEEIDKKPDSVGKGIPGLKIYIVNDHGEQLPSYQIGQLVIEGPTVMQGYWNKPEATKEKLKPTAFSDSKLLYTGDYGYLDNEGYFYYKGRMDEVIKCRGVKVMPKEIEDLVLQMEGIKEASVIDIKVNEDTALSLFVNIRKDSILTDRHILEYCRNNLEKEKIPRYILIINALPRNINGKVDKMLLREYFSNHIISEASGIE